MTQITVGIRELKTRLSSYLRQVKGGVTLVITERGKPVGRILPVPTSMEERVQGLVEAKLLSWSGHRVASSVPVPRVRAQQTVAELLLEDRE